MDELFVRLSELKFPLMTDTATPGRGNCLFAAVCQQLRREEIGLPNLYSHASLRKSICEFALALQDPRVITLSGEHNITAHASKRRSCVVVYRKTVPLYPLTRERKSSLSNRTNV